MVLRTRQKTNDPSDGFPTFPGRNTDLDDPKIERRRRRKRIWITFRPRLFITVFCALLLVYTYFGTTFLNANIPLPLRLISAKVNATSTRQIPSTSPVAFLPVVERSVLDKLARLEEYPDPDERAPFDAERPKNAWPPLVTRIPEPKITYDDVDASILSMCARNLAYCRFLLPLRLAEQESKARLHFLQVLQLARELDRTVVLPNVGKSRMGTCFKWDFSAYYDAEALAAQESVRVVKMELFKEWIAMRSDSTSGQIISVSAKPVSRPIVDTESFFSVADAVITVADADDKLTACLGNKFQRLLLDSFSPLFVNPSDERAALSIGYSLVRVLTQGFGKSPPSSELQDADIPAHEADVLIINWDLRHPAFSVPTEPPLTLSYTPALLSLATKLAPRDAYLAIHWRMESVPPANLPDCAEALVDTLAALLHDPVLAAGVRTVWFASDYPYAISRRHARAARSGTFRNLAEEHEEAVDVLRAAFDGGALAAWELTGLSEGLDRVRAGGGLEIDDELAQDAGVLGILDKIVASDAAIFVSGAKGCGRTSSYTKQVIDSRTAKRDSVTQRNIADFFG